MESIYSTDEMLSDVEAFLNDQAIYRNSSSINGWLIWKEKKQKVHLRLRTENGNYYPVEWKQSSDVAAYDYYKEMNPDMVDMCRFSENIYGEKIEAFQVITEEGTVLDEIMLMGTARSCESNIMAFSIDNLSAPSEQTKFKYMVDRKVNWLNSVSRFYQIVNPFLYWAAIINLITLVVVAFRGVRRKEYSIFPFFLVVFGIILSYIVLLAGVSYTHISAFDAINYMYLSPAYPLLLAAEVLLCLHTIDYIKIGKRFNSKRQT